MRSTKTELTSAKQAEKARKAIRMLNEACSDRNIDDFVRILQDNPEWVNDAMGTFLMGTAISIAEVEYDWSYIRAIAESRKFNPSHADFYFKALKWAIRSGMVPLVELLLAQEVPTSNPASQFFGLHEAVYCPTKKQDKIIRLLLSNGASPDEKNHENYAAGEWSFILDQRSSRKTQKCNFVMLLAAATNKEDYNKTRYGRELSLAAGQGNVLLVLALLELNINVTWQDENGNTCLHAAVLGAELNSDRWNQENIIHRLLSFEPRLDDIQNSNGFTPLQYANLKIIEQKCSYNMGHNYWSKPNVIFNNGWKAFRKDQAPKEDQLMTIAQSNQSKKGVFKDLPISLITYMAKFFIYPNRVTAKPQEVLSAAKRVNTIVYLRRSTTSRVQAFLQDHHNLHMLSQKSKDFDKNLRTALYQSPFTDTVQKISDVVGTFVVQNDNPFSQTFGLLKQHRLITIPAEEKRMPNNNQPSMSAKKKT